MKSSVKNLKVSNIGPANNTLCLMVAISWTTAAVAHIKANKTFTMSVEQVSLVRGVYTFIKHIEIEFYAGQEIFFCQSNRAGYYYINLVGHQTVSCSCTAAMNHQQCHHMTIIGLAKMVAPKLNAVRKPAAITVEAPAEVQAAISTGVQALREQIATSSVGITPGMSREEVATKWTKWDKGQRKMKRQVRKLAIAS